MNQVVADTSLSRLEFCDLVLDTAIELERARQGEASSSAPLERLADALSRASKPIAAPVEPAFVEATFYDPFERMFRAQNLDSPQSIEHIQAFITTAVNELRAVETGDASPETIQKLVDFCITLHQEMAREIEAEEADFVDDWRTSDVAIASSLGQTPAPLVP